MSPGYRSRGWAVWALLGLACGTEVPLVSLDVTQAEGTAPIPGLERLRLVIQGCAEAPPLLTQNLAVRGEPTAPIEAALPPGTPFYAWLQGWLACVGPCIAADQAQVGDCTCVSDGDTAPAQLLVLEACTDWTQTEVPVTLKLSLAPPAQLCPPLLREGCVR